MEVRLLAMFNLLEVSFKKMQEQRERFLELKEISRKLETEGTYVHNRFYVVTP